MSRGDLRNISDILWDEECTGASEYQMRRDFYGYLNNIPQQQGSPAEVGISLREDISEYVDYDPALFYSTGVPHASTGFVMDDELFRYSLYGLEALWV